MDQQREFMVAEVEGIRRVWIDGDDLTNEAHGVEVIMAPGQTTSVVLYTNPSGSNLSGRGFIYMQPRVDGSVLNDLDPFEIEQIAMEREQWGTDKRLVENVIDIIKEQLSGQGT